LSLTELLTVDNTTDNPSMSYQADLLQTSVQHRRRAAEGKC